MRIKKVPVLINGDWVYQTFDYFDRVDNVLDIQEAYLEEDRLKVIYRNGNEVWYKRFDNSWEYPVNFD